MKTLVCLFLLILPMRLAAMVADPVDHAAELIKSNNAAELGKLFAPMVDITLPGSSDMYSAAQATAALDRFFKANTVRGVKVVHRINSNPTIKYAVLSVATTAGSYRISISLKSAGSDFKITELRVEADKG